MFSASAIQGRTLCASSADDRRHVERVGHRAGQQIIGNLLGHLQGDILLRFRGGGAQMRRRHHLLVAEQRILVWPAPPRTRRRPRRRHDRSRARPSRAASSTSPPRAQLMIRTPFFILAIASAEMMLRVSSVSGVCNVMKSARARRSSSSTFSTPEIVGAFRRQIGIVGDRPASSAPLARSATMEPILPQPMRPKVLPVQLHAHEAVLFPFAGMGGGVRGGNVARQRHHQRDGVFGRGDGIAEGRVHHDDARGGRRRNIDIVDADAGAADRPSASSPRG